MEWSPKLFFYLILGALFTFLIVDLGYQTFVTDDVGKSLENSIKGGMQQSINKGELRVSEKMTIDSERFKGFYRQLYTNNQSVKNAEETTVYYAKSEFPPMIALRTTGGTESFFNKMMGESSNVTSNKKEIVIIEKKQ
ncbi:DUF5411 family protein [Heyndrickxia oleronia]|uniref:DUF5411 family protein n=1 Tax=Heyndrickxia oleronia TaxID=38875 RepID=UPI001B0A2893|nr:DUF5411 family protein [Heyndrickxia oleronia]GIN41423.1 hypothetical protein J19TS1_43720 [Heyndrickxia oleronia]